MSDQKSPWFGKAKNWLGNAAEQTKKKIEQSSHIVEQATDKAKKLGESVTDSAKDAISQAKSVGEATSNSTKEVFNKAREVSASVSQTTKDVVGTVQQVGGEVTEKAKDTATVLTGVAGTVREQAVQKFNQILPEVIVQTYLLPTGTQNSDFYCYFDFTDIALQVNSGLMVRPKLVVWTSREDIDRKYLAEILKDSFEQQMNTARFKANNEREQNNQNTVLPEIQEKLQKQRSQLASESSGSLAVSGIFAMLGLTSPPATAMGIVIGGPTFLSLLMFGMAISGGITGVSKALEYLSVSSQIRDYDRCLKQSQTQLESQFTTKSKNFMRSINNMKIRVHPELQNKLVRFCRIDGISLKVSPTPEQVKYPNVSQILKNPQYLKQVPFRYR